MLSKFILNIMAAIFNFNGSGRLGRGINLYQGGRRGEERGGGRGVKNTRLFSPPPPPTPTVHSNCKSNIAGLTNDRELLALAHTNKTPALQAIATLII